MREEKNEQGTQEEQIFSIWKLTKYSNIDLWKFQIELHKVLRITRKLDCSKRVGAFQIS